jgi:hypothetical protein
MIEGREQEREVATPVLSAEEIAFFERWGYVRVPGAFAHDAALAMQDVMWEELQALHGIDRQDRATWTHPWPAAGVKRRGTDPVFRAVAAPRLCGAIDQLLGKGSWEVPKGWGIFLISFPKVSPSPWELPTRGWHWDSDPFQHLDGLNGLFVFTFYSEVRPRGGGTLAVAGSPRLLERFLGTLAPDDPRKHVTLKKRFSRSHPWLAELSGNVPGTTDRVARFMEAVTEIDGIPAHVLELTGEPGDAILCHPSMVHAVAPNPAEAPRFMRAKQITRQAHV